MSRTAWQRRPPDTWVKQNDVRPTLDYQLRDGNGAVVDLTGASVKFMMYLPGAASPKVNAAGTIIGAATNGQVRYTWTGTDTDTIGDYIAEFQVTFSGGFVETFPNWEHLKVRILDDIAA